MIRSDTYKELETCQSCRHYKTEGEVLNQCIGRPYYYCCLDGSRPLKPSRGYNRKKEEEWWQKWGEWSKPRKIEVWGKCKKYRKQAK